MRFQYALSLALAAALAPASQAQWSDIQAMGSGGESTIAVDGIGNVYLTCHEPCSLFVSHNWGSSYKKRMDFPDAFCDMDVFAQANGQVNVVYIKNGINGLGSWYSNDQATTMNQGTAPQGPLDREWLAVNPKTGNLFMDYSHGYIGGPKSTGVFLCKSTDRGKTFKDVGRVDSEPEGSYPVDPYLCNSSDGRIYALWQTTSDLDTIDKFNFAVSTDEGLTWKGRHTLTDFPRLPDKDKDTNKALFQERWILGGIAAAGPKTVVVVYPAYQNFTVNGKTVLAFVAHYKYSTDGGMSFSEDHTVLPQEELQAAVEQFNANMTNAENNGYYIQTLPWIASGPNGHFHFAFEDNRTGQGDIGGTAYDKWHVRYAECSDVTKGFGKSERVSNDVTCIRPPLDFLSIAADKKNTYISWTETPNVTEGWEFSGKLFVARKPI